MVRAEKMRRRKSAERRTCIAKIARVRWPLERRDGGARELDAEARARGFGLTAVWGTHYGAVKLDGATYWKLSVDPHPLRLGVRM